MENIKKEIKSYYRRSIKQINLETRETIEIFNTIKEASLVTKLNGSSICQCCQGKIPHVGGYGWEYVTTKRIKYMCDICDYEFQSQELLKQHIPICKENITYIVCQICHTTHKMISKHLKHHNISTKEYKNLYPNACLVCEETHNVYTIAGDWITRKKEAGEDLSEYCAKMGKAVSDSIMSNPKERERRSAQLTKNNKTQEARDLARKTAIKTSSREDILVQRTERLHHARQPSKAENVLKEILLPIGFLHSQVVKDKNVFTTTKTGRRVLDFIHLDKHIIVEFDGGQHFTASFQNQSMELTKLSDDILNNWAINNGYCMIRISYEYFSDRHKTFDQQLLNELFEIINNPQNKLYKLGKAYECQT